MDRAQIETLLNEVQTGSTSVADALDRLRNLPFEDLGFAKVDHHRALRTGMPEVIFSERKAPAQVAAIFARMAKAGGNVLATRASREVYEAVRASEAHDQGPRAEFHEGTGLANFSVAVDPGPVYRLGFVKFENVSNRADAYRILRQTIT